MGEVSLQKEILTIANSMKESKSIKSFDSFELLATMIIFPKGFHIILEKLHKEIIDTFSTNTVDSFKVLSKFEQILKNLSSGFLIVFNKL